MLIGQVLVAALPTGSGGSGHATSTAFTPWMSRAGDAAVFLFELLDMGGAGPEITVRVMTKNSEDADPGTQIGSSSIQTANGSFSIAATGTKELWRMEFTLLVDSAEGDCGVATARVRDLPPAWRHN